MNPKIQSMFRVQRIKLNYNLKAVNCFAPYGRSQIVLPFAIDLSK